MAAVFTHNNQVNEKNSLLFFNVSICLVGLAQPSQPNTANFSIKSAISSPYLKWLKYEVDSTLSNLKLGTTENTEHPDILGEFQSVLPAIVYYAHLDTICILVGNRDVAGCGLRLLLLGDSCKMFYLTAADGVPIVPLTCKLVLSKKTVESAGKPICGKIEFEGKPLHEINGGKEMGTQYLVYGRFQALDIKQ